MPNRPLFIHSNILKVDNYDAVQEPELRISYNTSSI